MCALHDIYGFERATPGAMAEYMVFPTRSIVHKLSRDIPAHQAAFVEPLSCALDAVERANTHVEDVVVVAGAGPIGLGMIAGARAKGARVIIALDMVPAKLEPAEECGADLSIEGSDHPSAVSQGLTLLRKQGTSVEHSVFGSDVTVDRSIIVDDKELDALGAHLGQDTWPAAIAMIESGVLPLGRICATQLPVSELQGGLDLVADGTSSVKVSLLPG